MGLDNISARLLKDSASVVSKIVSSIIDHLYLPFLLEVWKGVCPLQNRRPLRPKQLQADNCATYVEQDSGEGGT